MFFREKDFNWEQVAPGIERQITGYDDVLMMVAVRFQKEAIGVLHHHIHSQATYIAKGIFEVQIGTNKEKLATGDTFFVPSNIEHGVICLEEGILIDVFSPSRKDFLND